MRIFSSFKQRCPSLKLRLKSKQRIVWLADLKRYDNDRRFWHVVNPKLCLSQVVCCAIQNDPQFVDWFSRGLVQLHNSLDTIPAIRCRVICWRGQFWLQPIQPNRDPGLPVCVISPPPRFPSVIVTIDCRF